MGRPAGLLAALAVAATVVAGCGGRDAPAPEVQLVRVTAARSAEGDASFRFDLPDTVAGDALLEVTNTSAAEPHEMIVFRLDDGAGGGDVAEALDAGAPPPATALGGLQAIPPGPGRRSSSTCRPATTPSCAPSPRRTAWHTTPAAWWRR